MRNYTDTDTDTDTDTLCLSVSPSPCPPLSVRHTLDLSVRGLIMDARAGSLSIWITLLARSRPRDPGRTMGYTAMDSSTMPDATIHEQQLRDCWPLPSALFPRT